MSTTPNEGSSEAVAPGSPRPPGLLGVQTEALAGLTVDQLEGNKTAITMLLHYYKQLVDENSGLKNEINTLRTYVDAYNQKRNNSFVGALLLLLSNVSIGFGVNLLTDGQMGPGIATLATGVSLAAGGLYLSIRGQK